MRIAILLLILSYAMVKGQSSDLPTDFLSSGFHKERRAQLRAKLPINSVAVFFSAPIRNRSADVDYKFHQNPDFFYLTGYTEANSMLLIFKDKQSNPSGDPYDEIIFVQPRNEYDELWTGRRLGDAGVKNQLGFTMSFNNREFKRYNVDFTKFDKVLFMELPTDLRDDPQDSSDLADLIKQFKKKVQYPEKESLTVQREPQKNNLDVNSLNSVMNSLRGVKTKEELVLIRKAVMISCQAQIEVMKAMKPGMSEMEVQGIHEFVYKKYQAEDVGYPSIVGSGHNGCILHYEENYKPVIDSKDLILMDVGAEYHGYTADVTRTIPINGKFSAEQKAIYELVLKSQEESIKLCKAGATFRDISVMSHTIVNKGLKELGIIKSDFEGSKYFPHGTSHHIGLDVHDRGNHGAMEENMVITVEPGIYIPEGSNCDPKWWGIAVRIEDDILITKDGYENLSKLAPRTVKDIEEMMKLPSPLDAFVLPDLDKKN